MRNSERRAGARAVGGLIIATTAGRLIVVAVLAGLLAAAIAVPVVGVAGIVARDAAKTFSTMSVPTLSQLPERSEIVDRKGNLIAYYYPGGIDRQPVTYDQIAPVMRNAIVAIEDSRFYQHGALDPRGTLRAVVNNLRHKAVQGGSTLAQQYVKNALILTAKNPQQAASAYAPTTWRKLRELRIAAVVEHEMTKQELLAAYLNAAYFEQGAWGIQVAAQRYFSTTAAALDLPQSAMLAGLVENPVNYDPVINPQAALQRRNVVLTQMARLHYITAAQATAAEVTPLRLHMRNATLQSGCTAASARNSAFFCNYVLAVLEHNKAFQKAYSALNTTGGLKIYTTMDPQEQRAAQHAVSYMVPPPPSPYNPGGNAATEVLVQPGTGKVRAIAVDRRYGTGPGQSVVDYAVDEKYNGGIGVQTGSSSKLFTLLTALKQNYPFGFNLKITSPDMISGYTSCNGSYIQPYPVSNAEGKSTGIYTLYNGTTQSINVFYAHLEQQVGLCNVVRTAASLGVHRADGKSLLANVGKPTSVNYQPAADGLASFTLGSVNVSPMTMAAAYATVAARGVYCNPVAISKIVTTRGASLPVQSAGCHRVLSKSIADAANYILQGVFTAAGATGTSDAISAPAAGKTGTANNFQYVAFAGYTPRLAGYVSMFNPTDPVTHPMNNYVSSCYRTAAGAQYCPGQIFGADAGHIWQLTFQSLYLGSPPPGFVGVPATSPFFRLGDGVNSPKPPAPPKPPKKPGPTPTPKKTGGP